jgi:alpha-methylacyl-CoA racemase
MGPLTGINVVELAGIGPGPMACMLLADLGATVLRIERVEASDLGIQRPARFNLLLRNRQRASLDLKQPAAIEKVLELLESADVLVEGFRPGVAERLGLGPDVCLGRNPRLVYGRMTGWGQTGPLAHAAGHDLNYIALTGVLHAIGRKDQPPSIPLAIAGDMGGGALYLAMGILAALLEARTSGLGQVVDAAIVDGAASLATLFYGMHAAGQWQGERGTNILDSGAPFYDVYECEDGGWISIGPIEARFYAQLLVLLEIEPGALGSPQDREAWAQAKVQIARRFKTRTRKAWCDLLEGTDVCFAPVLSFSEAPEHPHMKARGTFITVDGVVQPAPAPRFSRTAPDLPSPPSPTADADIGAISAEWRAQRQAARAGNRAGAEGRQ